MRHISASTAMAACGLAGLMVSTVTGCARPAPSPAPAAPAATAATAATALADVAVASPAADRFRWSVLAKSPLGPRDEPIVTWAGRQLLEFGGLVAKDTRAASAGAAFSPATGRWRRVASVPAAAGVNPDDPSGLSLDPASVWTGRYLAVANGPVRSCAAAVAATCWTGAALYDPASNRWTRLTLPRQLDGLTVAADTWTGREIVVAAVRAGAFGANQGRLAVAAYTPATRRWRVSTPAGPRKHSPVYLELAAAGGRLFLWSLWERVAKTKDGFSERAGVDVFAMNSGAAWRNVTGSWPQGQFVPAPVATPDGILVSPSEIWCGVYCSPPIASLPGYFTSPSTLARTTIPAGPLGEANPAYVWARNAVIAVNQYAAVSGGGITIKPGDMARFDPADSRWTRLPSVPGHRLLSALPVWDGRELLALSGAGRLLALHR